MKLQRFCERFVLCIIAVKNYDSHYFGSESCISDYSLPIYILQEFFFFKSQDFFGVPLHNN